jgi:hypothetical protein
MVEVLFGKWVEIAGIFNADQIFMSAPPQKPDRFEASRPGSGR